MPSRSSCAAWHALKTRATAVVGLILLAQSIALSAPSTQPLVLHIAADPNNLPFSNDREEGFENKIARLIAHDLGAQIDYTWWAQRRGFFRDAIKHGESDLVMGVPTSIERVITTRPYYRSTYVFIFRADRGLDIRSFDDPILRKLKIGIPLVGGSSNSPPGQALANRGIIDNVTGYTLYGDYRESNPSSEIVTAVAKGDIDVAIVWGPLGAYFAKRQNPPLKVVPIDAPPESSTPFAYDIALGLKRDKPELKKQIDEILVRRKAEIEKILDEYDVPRLPMTSAAENEHASR